jgi:hypothetical protein
MLNRDIETEQAIFWPGEVVPINGDYIKIDETGRLSDDVVTLTKGDPFPEEPGKHLGYYFYEPCLDQSHDGLPTRNGSNGSSKKNNRI